MKGRVALLLVLLLVAGSGAWSKNKKKASKGEPAETPAPAPGLHVARLEGATRIDVVLPGDLIDFVVAAGEEGKRSLYLLGGPASPVMDPPRDGEEDAGSGVEFPPCPPGENGDRLTLYRVDPVGSGGLERLRQDLPGDGNSLISMDRGAAAGLLIVRRGRIDILDSVTGDASGSAAPLRMLAGAPDAAMGDFCPRVVRDPSEEGARRLIVAGLGKLDLYSADGEGEWGLRRSISLPTEATRSGPGFLLSSPLPRWIGVADGGEPLLATPPKAHGDRRLELLRIEPEAEEGSETVRAWCRLPGAEELLSGDLVLLDGRAALVATTRRSDKLSLFGERRLRVWYLEEDRSGSGLDPLFAVESRINLWQEPHPVLLDANGDGRDDLVVGYWKGLVKSRVVLDAYLRGENGEFDPSPRSTAFNVKGGHESVLLYGNDLDGDGLADLLLRNEEGLLVFRGLRSSDGENLVASEPARTLPLDGQKAPRPRIVDLDGDGRSEILLVREEGEQPNLQLFRLDPPR